jgi:uncharacterized DUF497 family protein
VGSSYKIGGLRLENAVVVRHSKLNSTSGNNYLIIMTEHRFTWDQRKNLSNHKKHGIYFQEAVTVFYDEDGVEYYDPDHSEDEDRFIMLGISRNLRVLVVSYCYRESETTIRIISSRKADNQEIRNYFRGGKL